MSADPFAAFRLSMSSARQNPTAPATLGDGVCSEASEPVFTSAKPSNHFGTRSNSSSTSVATVAADVKNNANDSGPKPVGATDASPMWPSTASVTSVPAKAYSAASSAASSAQAQAQAPMVYQQPAQYIQQQQPAPQQQMQQVIYVQQLANGQYAQYVQYVPASQQVQYYAPQQVQYAAQQPQHTVATAANGQQYLTAYAAPPQQQQQQMVYYTAANGMAHQ